VERIQDHLAGNKKTVEAGRLFSNVKGSFLKLLLITGMYSALTERTKQPVGTLRLCESSTFMTNRGPRTWSPSGVSNINFTNPSLEEFK
jgi:hypothetical protein